MSKKNKKKKSYWQKEYEKLNHGKHSKNINQHDVGAICTKGYAKNKPKRFVSKLEELQREQLGKDTNIG